MAPIFNFTDQVIAVTGGSSGIGYATVLALLSQGSKVSVADISLDRVTNTGLSEKYPEQFYAQVVDVSKPEQVNDWIEKTVEKFGDLDGAVNLAGVISKHNGLEAVDDVKDEDWHRIIDINLHGVMYSIRAELKHMKDGGSIINASSIAGLIGFRGSPAYTTSKHAVIGLMRSAAKDVGHRNIRVNCIAPGVIDTPMTQAIAAAADSPNHPIFQTQWQIARKGRAEEVAALICWLLSQSSSYITGTVQVIDGGWTC